MPPSHEALPDLLEPTEANAGAVPLVVLTERALTVAEKLSGIVHGLAEAGRRHQQLQDARRETGEAIPGTWSPSAARNATRSFTQAGEYLDDAIATLGDALRAAERLPDLADDHAASKVAALSSPRPSTPASLVSGDSATHPANAHGPHTQPRPPRSQDSSGPEPTL